MSAQAAVGATSLSLTTVQARHCWSSTAVPYSIVVAGQVFTVTAMTTPAGTGPYTQTATVVPAVNGINKISPAGSQVLLVDQPRWAF